VHRLTTPSLVTAIERGPRHLDVARRLRFGLADLGPMEFLLRRPPKRSRPPLRGAGRRFDFVMEDAAYADTERSRPVVQALVPLVAPEGTLVVNRHRRGDAGASPGCSAAGFSRPDAAGQARGRNVLIYASRPRAT